MTFAKFQELLHTKYPEAHACMHGKFAGTQGTRQVEINFKPGGKCYLYYGSYQDILLRLEIPVLYKADVELAEQRLREYIAGNNRPNPYSLFDDTPCDYSKEIEEYQQYIADIRNGKYIVID